MMSLDEGNGLMKNKESIFSMDSVIENASSNLIMSIAIILALGNAADAVEISCVGFIMAEMPEITSQQKGHHTQPYPLNYVLNVVIIKTLFRILKRLSFFGNVVWRAISWIFV